MMNLAILHLDCDGLKICEKKKRKNGGRSDSDLQEVQTLELKTHSRPKNHTLYFITINPISLFFKNLSELQWVLSVDVKPSLMEVRGLLDGFLLLKKERRGRVEGGNEGV